MQSSAHWDVYGPDLAKRYSCNAIGRVDSPARALIDDDRSLASAFTPWGMGLTICSSSGYSLLLPLGSWDAQQLERTNRRLFYTHDHVLSVLQL